MWITARNLRIAAAFALACTVIWVVAPYATSYISSQAVVNAPLNTVLSPMRGQIVTRSHQAGTAVAAGEPLIAVRIEARDRRFLAELTARAALLDESLASIDGEIAELRALEAVMSARVQTYHERMLARLAAELREAEAALAAAKADRDKVRATLDRTETLARRGFATVTRAEADAAINSSAQSEVDRLRARLERVRVEITSVEAGVAVQDGWSDVPYSQQRQDEIALRLASLAAERRRIDGERGGLSDQVAVEQDRITRRETFDPVAPSAGVIWKESGAVGETTVPGDVLVQLVDCDARFVEVTLPERHFGDIGPGDVAWIKLKGGGNPVAARVSAVLGAGAKFDHPRLAASVAEARPDQLRVLISLRGAGLDGAPGAFCHVGRTAEVRFARSDFGIMRNVVRAIGSQLDAALAAIGAVASALRPLDVPAHPARQRH